LRLHDWRAALKPRRIDGFERSGDTKVTQASVVWLDDQAASASLPFSKAKA
jgi:hypothetical protein